MITPPPRLAESVEPEAEPSSLELPPQPVRPRPATAASLLSPASTITTTLTTSMAVYAEGSAQDDVLWALGLLLMGMILIFILIIHLIGRKGAKARG